ncbi:carbamoyltransferase C-terminal domain-containing protein [Oceanobacter mangrovi]|uniref:carbamoyltransferase C-terminal domain-containing protein n=1 Tax=Oceanobacter mangrovi TaxID=2862510 RepID=UPI001C8CFDBC|nr:carbamoyltransferase C-terminal domain-containing protein [Oceanobacter mangrovi]
MNNGYYLSIYTYIDAIAAQNDIGVRHDQSMTLWHLQDDQLELVRSWEFERLSGVKHHSLSFPTIDAALGFINEQLAELQLSTNQLQAIIGTPGLGDTPYSNSPDSRFAYHNLCHLFSGLLIDSQKFQQQAILGLALDGGPDTVLDPECRAKDYYSAGYVKQGQLQLRHIPSPAVLWASLRQRFKMAEGSLMALGPATTAEYSGAVSSSPRLRTIADIHAVARWIDDLVAAIWATEGDADHPLVQHWDDRFCAEDNRLSMLVKRVQQESVDVVKEAVSQLIAEFDIKPEQTWLSITGGYALNCPSNSAIMDHFGFRGFSAPPTVNDSGMSLGIGLQHFYYGLQETGKTLQFQLPGAALGPADEDWQQILLAPEFAAHIHSCQTADPAQLAQDLCNSAIVWFDGNSEVGPRALGQRSLLSDPRTAAARDQLNQIKQRQWWRPVAPIVLAEQAAEWFDIRYQSPFMLHTFEVKAERRDSVPGICHLDQSARVQTLQRQQQPRLYQLISAFHQLTGVPIVCNTSLNDKGEPIVQTAAEALNFALRKGIPVVCINGQRIELQAHETYQATEPRPRPALGWWLPSDQLPPPALTRKEAMIYFHNPRLQRFDLSDPEQLKQLQRRLARIDEQFGKRADFRFIDIWHVQEHAHQIWSVQEQTNE